MALLVLPGHFPLRPACPRAADSVAAGLADHVAPRDRVLDIGCGTGQTTRDAARAAVAGSALGIDLSAQMLDHARRLSREEGLANVSFLQADARCTRSRRRASRSASAGSARCSSPTR